MDVLNTTRISKKALTAGIVAAAILGGGVSEASGLMSADSRAGVDAQVSSTAMLDATIAGVTDLGATFRGDADVRTDLRTDAAAQLDRGGTSGVTVTGQAASAADVTVPARVTLLGSTAADLQGTSAVNAGATVLVGGTVQGNGSTSTPEANTSADAQVAANVGANIGVTGATSSGASATVNGGASTDATVGLDIPVQLKGSSLLGVSLR